MASEVSTPTASSPLETVARNHGAAMASRHGRRVPAHFGSVGAEEAVCLRAVGMADRSDRDSRRVVRCAWRAIVAEHIHP